MYARILCGRARDLRDRYVAMNRASLSRVLSPIIDVDIGETGAIGLDLQGRHSTSRVEVVYSLTVQNTTIGVACSFPRLGV